MPVKNLYPLFLLIVLCCFSERSVAQQNHVPNPSFEDTISCPTSVSQVTSHCKDWIQYTSGTPDYFHSCGSTAGVPLNITGYQVPASGSAYVGLAPYSTTAYYEYISTNITALFPGKVYEVSMSVSLANKYKYASDNLGVYFYDNGPGTVSTTSLLSLQPQILFNSYGVITDTQNWTRLTAFFTADSAYDNIVIGGFNNMNNTFQVDSLYNASYSAAYYYIDSVVIKLADSFRINTYSTSLCAPDTINVLYGVLPLRDSNNVFTLQLSDKNGSFANPFNIGTKNDDSSGAITGVVPNTISNGTGYKMRIISSSPADTSESTLVNIKIANPDSSDIVVSTNSPLCEGNTISFSASTNVTPTTYVWSGPNSFTSSSATPSIAGANAVHNGNYYATLNFYGCEVKDTLPVTVKPLPVKPSVSNNTPICVGDTLILTGSSTTSGVTYSWAGPNSFTSSQQDPVLPNSTIGMGGAYTQTATLNGCSRSNTTTVIIKPLPQSTTLSTNAPFCEGDTLKLNSTSSNTNTTYIWSGPLSYNVNSQNTTRANASSSMSGYYKLLLDLNGCTVLDSIQATIHPIPVPPTVTANSPLCVGDTLKLTATSNNGTTYSWSGPTNFSSPLQNPDRINITLADAGTYIVNATANNCTSPSDSVSVNINPAPFVVILSNKDSICVGDLVTFTALPNNAGGTPTYQWYVNGQQVTSTGSTFTTTTLQNNAIVKVDITEYTKCANPYTDPSNDIQMRVLPWLPPSVSIAANPNGPVPPNQYITFTATPSDAGANPGYQWKRNGNNVVGANGMTWSANTLNDNDSISVQVISNYMCPQPKTDESNGIVVKILTGVGEIAREGALQVYPNPNNGRFIISGGVNQTDGTITAEVINAIGQKVYHKEMQVQNHKLHQEVELPAVASGNYLLRLQDEADSVIVYKLNIR